MKPIIAPSILACDFANLQQEIEMLNQSEADWIHVDIMDGVFVPNISIGVPICKAVHEHAKKPLDVHLMIVNPDSFIEPFKEAGATHITVHYEVCTHLHRTLEKIKKNDCKAGVAINPHTSVSLLEDVIGMIDIVLVMSVNPGFGGQEFIAQTYQKIRKLNTLIQNEKAQTLIEVDGGVSQENASHLLQAGAQVLVAGSSVFKSSNPKGVIAELKNTLASK